MSAGTGGIYKTVDSQHASRPRGGYRGEKEGGLLYADDEKEKNNFIPERSYSVFDLSDS